VTHRSESGRDRTERREHDRDAKAYEASTGNPWHLSKDGRLIAAIAALFVVLVVTALFVFGWVRW
jgi:hypothetical protein